MTSFYDRHVLPRLIGCACGAGSIRRQRIKIVPRAHGRVLELGIGGGLNLAFYDPARVQSVTGVDPSEGLRRLALAAPRPASLKVEILAGEAEALPFDTGSFDTVVCTFTLCSVHTPAAVLAEARAIGDKGAGVIVTPCRAVVAKERVKAVMRSVDGKAHVTPRTGDVVDDALAASRTDMA